MKLHAVDDKGDTKSIVFDPHGEGENDDQCCAAHRQGETGPGRVVDAAMQGQQLVVATRLVGSALDGRLEYRDRVGVLPDGFVADGEVVLGPGDVISIPIHVFRGFRNVGAGVSSHHYGPSHCFWPVSPE